MEHDEHGSIRSGPPNDSRGFIHRRLLGAAKGFFSGGVFGAARGFQTAGRATRSTTQTTQAVGRIRTTKIRLGPFGPSFQRTTEFTVPAGTGRAVAEAAVVGFDRAARGPVLPTADGCPKGFHLNKSSYTLKDGQRIEERTLCVRNRRRNNDNGKAAMRAARRLIGRKKAQDTIDIALKGIVGPAPRRRAKAAPKTGTTIVSTAG